MRSAREIQRWEREKDAAEVLGYISDIAKCDKLKKANSKVLKQNVQIMREEFNDAPLTKLLKALEKELFTEEKAA